MTHKYECDGCGAEVEHPAMTVSTKVTEPSKHLCSDCAAAFKDWLAARRKRKQEMASERT